MEAAIFEDSQQLSLRYPKNMLAQTLEMYFLGSTLYLLKLSIQLDSKKQLHQQSFNGNLSKSLSYETNTIIVHSFTLLGSFSPTLMYSGQHKNPF